MRQRHPDLLQKVRVVSGRWPSLEAHIVFVGCVSLLGMLLLMALASTLTAIVAIALAALLAVTLTLGLVRTATGFILLGMFFAPLNDVRPSSAVSFVTAADLFLVVGFLLLAPVIVFRRIAVPMYFVLGSIILVLTGVLASMASSDAGASLNHMARLVAVALGLPIAFMLWRPAKQTVARLAAAYLAGQVLNVAYGFYDNGLANGRYEGLTTHPNFFGLSSLLAVCLVPYLLSFTPPSWRWLPWAAGAVCVAGIWTSGSRAALLVFILVAVIYPLTERSVKAAGLLALTGAAVLAVSGRLLEDDESNALSRLLGGGHADYADLERERAFTEGVEAFWSHPFLGNGFVNPLAAHNIYLEIVVAVGIFGLLGYGFIMWSTVSPLFTLPHPFNQLAYPALAYAAIGLLTNALWDRFIWAALTLALVAHLLAEDEQPAEKVDSSPARRDNRKEQQ